MLCSPSYTLPHALPIKNNNCITDTFYWICMLAFILSYLTRAENRCNGSGERGLVWFEIRKTSDIVILSHKSKL